MTLITKDMVAKDIRKVAKMVHGTPSRSQYRAKGTFASETAERKFGSWTKAVKRSL